MFGDKLKTLLTRRYRKASEAKNTPVTKWQKRPPMA